MNDDSIKKLEAKMAKLEKHYSKDRMSILKYIQDNINVDINPVIEGYCKKSVRNYWKGLAEQKTDHSIQALVKHLWDEHCKPSGFEYEVEVTDEGVQMKCTYCPLVDEAKESGGTEIGYSCFCATDPAIVEGFNPNIGFKRTKTLMEGDECCDHFYYLKKK
ncbi:L-2-amino-thiazoline-4-carboxylic acid hydrolase [Mycoplasmatota bacterium zrk1]